MRELIPQSIFDPEVEKEPAIAEEVALRPKPKLTTPFQKPLKLRVRVDWSLTSLKIYLKLLL